MSDAIPRVGETNAGNFHVPIPSGVPADLAAPKTSYRRAVALAVVGISVFLFGYVALTAFFSYCFYRAAILVPHNPLWSGPALAAAILVFVLIRGLFVRPNKPDKRRIEVTRESEPHLFEFIYEVAGQVGAPKPNKIYLTPNVNAAVVQDIRLHNLIIPAKKDLIIGLGAMTHLSLDEFKAVLAHEFGHFSQRALGVAPWVSVSHRFVQFLVGYRGRLDKFLHDMSYWDPRLAWIAWALRILIWSVRSIVDQLYRFVVRLHRALMREQEYQADLVSVSVTGSDSLVHALHRLPAADESMMVAENILMGEYRKDRAIEDLYAVQEVVTTHRREVFGLSSYGVTPERSDERVFKRALAETPQMWSTHPPNYERERNCKQHYIASALLSSPAMSLLHNPQGARREMTRRIIEHLEDGRPKDAPPVPNLTPVPLQETIDKVDEEYTRPSLAKAYRGLYTVGRLYRCRATELTIPPAQGLADPDLIRELQLLLGEDLAELVEANLQQNHEVAHLQGLEAGRLEAPGGVIEYQGQTIDRADLSDVVLKARGDANTSRDQLGEVFRKVHGYCLEIARRIDAYALNQGAELGWEQYLHSLLTLLREMQHQYARLNDRIQYFYDDFALAMADGSISKKEMKRLAEAANDLVNVTYSIYQRAQHVRLPDAVRIAFTPGGKDWPELYAEDFRLQAPTPQTLTSDWLRAGESWWNSMASQLADVEIRILDHMVETEERLFASFRQGQLPQPAPKPAHSPEHAPFHFGEEVRREMRLTWWEKFQLAEGWFASAMRFAVAAAVLVPTFGFMFLGVQQHDLTIVNPLAVPVHVTIRSGGEVDSVLTLMPETHAQTHVEGDVVQVETRRDTSVGEVLEAFETPDMSGMADPVYSVLAGALFLRAHVRYGRGEPPPAEPIPHSRFFDADATYLLTEPPLTGAEGSRSVLVYADPAVIPQHFEPQDLRTMLGAWSRVGTFNLDQVEATVQEVFSPAGVGIAQ